MRYRLRTLLIVVTVLGIPFARIGYLRSKASFHRNEVKRRLEQIMALDVNKKFNTTYEEHLDGVRYYTHPLERTETWKQIRQAKAENQRNGIAEIYFHQIMADRFDRAVYRPWKLVSETE